MRRLLIVEDDNAYRQFLSVALDMAGYHVYAAGSGEEAIEVLQEVDPELVLLDLSMPHVTGWDVFHFMRDHAALKHVPVLVITANADEYTRRQALDERVNSLLVKPLSLDEILAAVEKLIL
jgi:DNA-binding response OmpR family regulator